MRRPAHDQFVGRAASSFEPFQEREAAVLLSHILEDPADWENHLMRYGRRISEGYSSCSRLYECRSAASAILSSVYGRKPLGPDEDSVVVRINDITHRLGGAIPSLPGASLVQFLPWMRFLPEYLAPWKRIGNDWCNKDTTLLLNFLRDAKTSTVRSPGVR